MSTNERDLLLKVANHPVGKQVLGRIGLPRPAPLERWQPGRPLISGPVLLGEAPAGRLGDAVRKVLAEAGSDTRSDPGTTERFKGLVFDASGISGSGELKALYDFFHPVIRRTLPSGRVIVLGTPPEEAGAVPAAIAQRALEGFVRSVGKELRGGATAQLLYVSPGAEDVCESTLRFLLSPRSAYVSGQVVRVRPVPDDLVVVPDDWDVPLRGRVAAVTGAARGIGAAIARTFARDGAHVVCVDLAAQGDALAGVANEVGGEAVQLDITAADAPERLIDHVRTRHGGLDVMVHNAGITRDKTLANMREDAWTAVIEVNLAAQERFNDALLSSGILRRPGRIVSVSSMVGIAGQRGQTNYATSKAGIIGMVQALAAPVAERGATINAVAPGFIETDMTAAMPFGPREAGRRMNSLSQGGLPVDVAETIAWLAGPATSGVNGQVVRVCGQSLVGA